MSDIFPERKNDILNNLTEYQLLYLVKFGKFTKHKHSMIGERFLVENLKVYLIKNLDILKETLSENQITDLASNLVPLSERYLSSSSSVLKELESKDMLSFLLTEAQYEWRRDPETGDKLLIDVVNNRIVKRVSADASKEELQKVMAMAMRATGVITSTSAAVDALGSAGRGIASAYRGGKKLLVGTKEKAGLIDTIKKKSSSGFSAVNTLASKIGYANLGYGALAAAALYGATKLYKNYLSKAARSCSNLTGEEKHKCITNYKANAIRSQIVDLEKSTKVCDKTSNPAQCKMVVQNKIQKLKNKIGNI